LHADPGVPIACRLTKRSRPVTNIRIGLDTSKHVFQVHGVNGHEQPVLRRRLQRSQAEKFFANTTDADRAGGMRSVRSLGAGVA
jgi:transposase